MSRKDRRSGRDRRNWNKRVRLVRKFKSYREREFDRGDIARELNLSKDVINRMCEELGGN